MPFIGLLACLLLIVQGAAAQEAPAIEWNATFSADLKNKFESVQQIADGGYIAAGSSIGTNFSEPEDLLLVRTDSAGNEAWNRTYDGLTASSVIQTGDGGYAIAANTIAVTPGETTGAMGTAYLIKTDDAGNIVWNAAFEGQKASVVRQTTDGGYALIGWTWNPAGSTEDTDAIITKTDSEGNQTWNRSFAGRAAYAGQQTDDGGYILGGTKSPFAYDAGDAFLIRLEADGTERWSRNLDLPSVYALGETFDGGYIVTGSFWYARVDAEGNELWKSRVQGLDGWAALQAPGGGYLIAGQINDDAVAMKTDDRGTVEWNLTFPHGGAYAADLTDDGGYILAGITFPEMGATDAWMMKLRDTAEPGQATPGFGTLVAMAAVCVLLALWRRR
ncbi:hypothetical protein FGU65_10440 [Methanoculleus sp. FWC-SCC1]|uniref:Outer membrane protein assembly factor BamB, contains PQQ-like beta-propeller repeat n=1 Tax=Methanoculleus frigidifontis TaxID=2584085 RepID=A0ABT8MBI7_9EURY|nr:hypothetical protein [Methanoculleus sp. FWC-SCC1]MDN7025305.1 hypothetical protein [Methanoculleus sp. FWC-SCC1]